jgi:hypothetical protein
VSEFFFGVYGISWKNREKPEGNFEREINEDGAGN